METYGMLTLKVDVDPSDIIENLIKREIGDVRNNWVIEIDSKFYLKRDLGYEIKQEEISKSRFDYVKSLQTALNYIKENNIK